MMLFEISSRSNREKIVNAKFAMTDSTGAVLKIDRAKTSQQLKRNGALQKASDLLKKDPKTKNKEVKIVWQITGQKTRAVAVEDENVLVQEITDMTGKFAAGFSFISPSRKPGGDTV